MTLTLTIITHLAALAIGFGIARLTQRQRSYSTYPLTHGRKEKDEDQ